MSKAKKHAKMICGNSAIKQALVQKITHEVQIKLAAPLLPSTMKLMQQLMYKNKTQAIPLIQKLFTKGMATPAQKDAILSLFAKKTLK